MGTKRKYCQFLYVKICLDRLDPYLFLILFLMFCPVATIIFFLPKPSLTISAKHLHVRTQIRHPDEEEQTQVATPRSKDSRKKRLLLNCFIVNRQITTLAETEFILYYFKATMKHCTSTVTLHQILTFHKARPLG